jgi:CheY-like chemotaxis protein
LILSNDFSEACGIGVYLKEDGYRVEARDNAAAAISLLKKEPFDLVLMDIQMPELDGVAATRVIRAMDPPLGRIPIIALTGNVLPQQIQSFLDAGMNDHVGKPIDRDHLHEKVALWMESPGGAVPPRAPAAMDFDPSKFESFLANFGSAWVEEHAGKFAKTLEAAFASTIDCSRREAHQLLNFAGLLGFDRLVELCRDVETMSPDDPAALARAFEDLRAERAAALRRLKDVVLPATRATIVAGAIGMRDSAVPNRSV